jgi:uncharacterized membrane protein YeaQ/YmgE (transglycosylase-associated protein family)
VAVAGAWVGVVIPSLFPAYAATLTADIISGLVGALVASAIWVGLRL